MLHKEVLLNILLIHFKPVSSFIQTFYSNVLISLTVKQQRFSG